MYTVSEPTAQLGHVWTTPHVRFVCQHFNAAYSSALYTWLEFCQATQGHSALPFLCTRKMDVVLELQRVTRS